MTEYKLERHREFYIENASEAVWYSFHKKKKTIFGKEKWVKVRVPFWDGMGVSMYDTTGDESWAKRIAKEYKIKVPTK